MPATNDPPKVLMLCSNTATSPVTGWPIGFWWAELTHAYKVFEDVGYEITIASPDGGDLMGDGYSDPEDASGYSADDHVSLAFKQDPAKAKLLEGTPALADLDLASFDALFVVGGQGPMVTMIDDARVHKAFAAQLEAGKPAAAVCHGTCILLKARGSDGELLARGRTWTGFANSEEEYSEHAAGQKIQPFWIETEARKIEGTTFVVKDALTEHAITDGNLVTGQQQVSSGAAARHVVALLGGAAAAA
jgi:putative intracellular protease/amidase